MNYVSDLNSTESIECMFLKLPLCLQIEWVEVAYKILKTGREPLFKDLCEFVKKQSDIANTRYGLLVNTDPSNRNQMQPAIVTERNLDSEYRARVSFASTSKSDVPPHVRRDILELSCLLCTEKHPLDQCGKFRDKDINERIEFVLKKLCNVCLKTDHITRDYRVPRSCTVEGCGWKHHTLLHRKNRETAIIMSTSVNNSVLREVLSVHRDKWPKKIVDAKPKTEAPSANRPKFTQRKPKEKKVSKPKVETPKKPKAIVTKKLVTKILEKQAAHILYGFEKGSSVRVVNKSKDESGSFKGANASLRQIMCGWDQNKIANALLKRGCEWRFNLPRASRRGSARGRIIKSIRRIVRSLLFQKVLMDESLETFLIEAEVILNNRPLIKLVNDCDNLVCMFARST
ncbi:LIM domain and actin-binding protein 1, variant 3 [Schistosoma haematobium]|uniref:LIM domain and actin-binding protein 1, variant 3 n=1 Tax=Schistosoma haematobium TaxID=6185 RepID=A0A922LPR6_SCHHA|nr:LIM domain and actin-binding protein 1, variant 3 [Schistosoma haematobium]KAH9591002.1 LIM domain and actin-binding protein 1, variant 3 [Schistosoma haematobium]